MLPRSTQLPPVALRTEEPAAASDQDYLAGAMREARVLRRRAGLSPRSRVLDWGCGAGRLAIGIRHVMGHVADYHGIDLRPEHVAWATEHLADEHVRFSVVPPGATPYEIEGGPDSVDLLYTGEHFAHLVTADVSGWARGIAAVLAPRGRVVLSALVQQDVPDSVERDGAGQPLDVTYERGFFEAVLYEAGLAVEEYVHGREAHGRSFYVLAHR